MENKKKTTALVAKTFGGVLFAAMFVLNMMLFVQRDSKTGSLSATALTANAQGENSGVLLDKDLEVDWVNGGGMTGWCYSCCPDATHYCRESDQTCGGNNGDC